MIREHLRVTPTTSQLNPGVISTALANLHKLPTNESASLRSRLIPFQQAQPVTFEFVAMSEGEGDSVEFYYGANDRLARVNR
jgi:hypothetical protein